VEDGLQFITGVLSAVETSEVGLFVAQSLYAFSALDMVHVAAITLVFGMIALLDLRLMGLAFTDYPVTVLSRQVLPWTWAAFAVSAVTGGLMFTGQAVKYSVNFGFRMKLALMAAAGVNVLVFHFITYRGVAKWDHGVAVPLTAKFAGGLSLACWIAVVIYGRFTAYYHFP
jgi:hypothetical protein